MTAVFLKSLKKVFSIPVFSILAFSLSINLLGLYYLIFLQTTTPEVFFASNSALYNWTSIILSVINSAMFGIATTMLIYSYQQKKSDQTAAGSTGVFGAIFGAVSTGCPVCGAYLLPLLGIAGSLAAFPFQGLEIKAFSIILLALAMVESAKSIMGLCSARKDKLFDWDKKNFIVTINKHTLSQSKPLIVLVLFIIALYTLPKLPSKYKFSFAAKSSIAPNTPVSLSSASSSNVDIKAIFSQVNPEQGYTVNASFGDIGPRLLSAGVIDFEKLKEIYDRSGSPLTSDQIDILTKGSNKKITINKQNAYFLINFLWAVGLANKNEILDSGAMVKYGKWQIGSFASTGGWTIGKMPVEDIYSKTRLISLTSKQQAIVQEAADSTYRPCCGNPTSFPDCNHGMAMLGLYELMASQGASVDELFEAGKYFNAFWFPQQTLDIATYFKVKENREFRDIDPRIVVSRNYSSAQGWSNTKRWLSSNKIGGTVSSGGGGCGV